jgi:Zn-dependent protease with chaperone function
VGIGASKRIVVWDTTTAKMSTLQIVFVAGHEMDIMFCSIFRRG